MDDEPIRKIPNGTLFERRREPFETTLTDSGGGVAAPIGEHPSPDG